MSSTGYLIKKGRTARNMTQQEVADAVGVSKQAISQYENGHAEPKEEVLDKLSDLLYLSSIRHVMEEPAMEYKISSKMIPYYDVDVTAGNMEIFKGDALEKAADYFYIPGFSDCTACVNVRGDSMYSKYCAGDIIAIKLIEDIEVIQFGEAYVITTREQNLFKYIRRNPEDNETWLLESEYKERYDSFPIRKDKVLNIFLVRGVVRAKTM